MTPLLKQLREHPWLAHALLGIVAILGLYGVLVLRDANAELAQTCDQQETQRLRLESAAGQTEWPQRRAEIQSRLAQLQTRLWQAPTAALAQARVQDRLNMIIRQQNLQAARLQVGSPTPVSGAPLTLVKAQLDFRLEPAALPTLLATLLTNAPEFVIEELDFRDQEGSRVNLGLAAYFREGSS